MMPFGSAVITGAAAGIGAALARHLAGDGAKVVLADIEIGKAQGVADAINAAGGDAQAFLLDQGDAESIARFAEDSVNWIGHAPDLVLANAGVGAGGAIYSTPRRNIDWVLGVNLIGPIELARAFVPLMIERGQLARFVTTASEHAVGLPSRGGQASIYTISKHGALGFAEVLRRDLDGTCVSASVICPAVVNTDIWNTMRNRPLHYGGPRLLDETHKPDPVHGLSPDAAAQRIVDGLEAGEFYVFTHGQDIAEVHRARADELDAALNRFSNRYGAST
jgi:NAD(P)-dependent dehydrogenase (short-subunit alcohol dehydrogenase family)